MTHLVQSFVFNFYTSEGWNVYVYAIGEDKKIPQHIIVTGDYPEDTPNKVIFDGLRKYYVRTKVVYDIDSQKVLRGEFLNCFLVKTIETDNSVDECIEDLSNDILLGITRTKKFMDKFGNKVGISRFWVTPRTIFGGEGCETAHLILSIADYDEDGPACKAD